MERIIAARGRWRGGTPEKAARQDRDQVRTAAIAGDGEVRSERRNVMWAGCELEGARGGGGWVPLAVLLRCRQSCGGAVSVSLIARLLAR